LDIGDEGRETPISNQKETQIALQNLGKESTN
jgi:hypothetical protein